MCVRFGLGLNNSFTPKTINPPCQAKTRPHAKRILACHRRLGGGPRVVVSTAAFHARVRGSVPGLGGLKRKKKLFLPHPRVNVSIVGSLRDREVACSASDRQRSNFESCVRSTVLASDPCTRLLDGCKVKMTGTNCQNYTIKEEVHGQLCQN